MLVRSSFQHESVLGMRFGHKWMGKPKMTVLLYYVDGLLIDTGQSRLQKHILQSTKDLKIDQILVTHHHEDHTGNIAPLRKMHNCSVYASRSCCDTMTDPPHLSFVQKFTWGDRPPIQDLTPVQNHIKTPQHHFEILPIPGHADDMIALYEPDRKWLFSADLYINSYIGYYLRNESMLEQINSIKKILELDFNVMFCSHKPQFTQPKTALKQKLSFLEDFYNRVSTLYDKGNDVNSIMSAMALKENILIKTMSFGSLSQRNMVLSAIRDHHNFTNSKS